MPSEHTKDLSSHFSMLVESLVSDYVFLTSFDPIMLVQKLDSLTVNLKQKQEFISLGYKLLCNPLMNDRIVDTNDSKQRWDIFHSIIHSVRKIGFDPEKTLVALLKLEIFYLADDVKTQELFKEITAVIFLDSTSLHFHIGHIFQRYQSYFLKPVLEHFKTVLTASMSDLQEGGCTFPIESIKVTTEILRNNIGYLISNEIVENLPVKIQCCHHLIQDMEWFGRNSDSSSILFERSYRLRIVVICSFALFIIRHHEELPLILLIQSLLMMLKSPFLQSRLSLFDLTFDITGFLLDELPKSQQGGLVQWVNENLTYYLNPDEQQARINSLLPSPREISVYSPLVGLDPETLSKPWELIEVGSKNAVEIAGPHSNNGLQNQSLNPTCIPLARVNGPLQSDLPSDIAPLQLIAPKPTSNKSKRQLDEKYDFEHISKKIK
jgi:hypothetical protein